MLFYRRRGAIVKVKEDRERKAVVLEERWKRFEGRGGGRRSGHKSRTGSPSVRGKCIPLVVMRCGVVLWGFWSESRDTLILPSLVSVSLFAVSDRRFLLLVCFDETVVPISVYVFLLVIFFCDGRSCRGGPSVFRDRKEKRVLKWSFTGMF